MTVFNLAFHLIFLFEDARECKFDLGTRPKSFPSFAEHSKNHVEFNFHLISYFSLAGEMSKNDYTFKLKCAQIITRGLYYANYINFSLPSQRLVTSFFLVNDHRKNENFLLKMKILVMRIRERNFLLRWFSGCSKILLFSRGSVVTRRQKLIIEAKFCIFLYGI